MYIPDLNLDVASVIIQAWKSELKDIANFGGKGRGRWVIQRTPQVLATSVSCVQWNGETALKEKWRLDCYFLLEALYKCKMSQGRLFLYFPFCLILFAKILSAKHSGSKRRGNDRGSLSVICLLVEFMDIRGFAWLVFLNTQCAHKIERTNCAVCSFHSALQGPTGNLVEIRLRVNPFLISLPSFLLEPASSLVGVGDCWLVASPLLTKR